MVQLLPDSLKILAFKALTHQVKVSGCHVSHEGITVGILADCPSWETNQQTGIYQSEDASRIY